MGTLDSEGQRRAAAEVETRASAERLRTVIDATADAIIVITPDGLIESANPATETLFGYVPAELLGHNINMLMPEPDPASMTATWRLTGTPANAR